MIGAMEDRIIDWRARFGVMLSLWLISTVVLLACGSTVTSTPESVTVRLAPSGGGDFESLEAALEAVPPGSTINLDPGTYSLTAALDIKKPMKLVGAGVNQTFIVSTVAGYALRVSGSGPFAATRITFRHEGQEPADVVVIEDGEFAFANCRFTGAFTPEGEEQKAGLRIKGGAVGVVQDSEAVANSVVGIWIMDQAQPLLEWNTLADNALFGILYEGSTRGTASQNAVTGAGAAGIQVAGQAAPTLENNGCMQNGTGIAFLDQAQGIASRNECSRNDTVGISVGNEAQPALEGNTCNQNLYGIVYAGSKGGVARQNSVTQNSVGVLIGEDASPEMEGNNIYGNEEEDIRDLRP